MFSWLERTANACLRPVRRYSRMNKDDDGSSNSGNGGGFSKDDPLLWSRDLVRHFLGEFSIAVVQANDVLEDHSQVETGRDGTFVGVYDGHGGPDASRYVRDHLFPHLMRIAREKETISDEVLKVAFSETEKGFLSLVRRTCKEKPMIAATGTCCLVGVIWRGTLLVANAGDSRAVLVCLDRSNNIVAEQLTKDHNASSEEVRQDLRTLHPDDSHIVVLRNGAWRVKGIIQVSKSIGDAYLKWPGFLVDTSLPRFRLAEPLIHPVLTAVPSIYTRAIRPQDKFLIFASDGLWDQMTNQEAAEIVFNYPRAGIARRLVKRAITAAGRKRDMKYDEVKKVEKGRRRILHDDITVVVIFLDHELLEKKADIPEVSVRGFIDTVGPSDFSVLDGNDVN